MNLELHLHNWVSKAHISDKMAYTSCTHGILFASAPKCRGTVLASVRPWSGKHSQYSDTFNARTMSMHLAGVSDNSTIGVSEVSLLPEASDLLAKDKIRKPRAEARG